MCFDVFSQYNQTWKHCCEGHCFVMFFSVVKQGNILGETSSIRTNFVKHCLRKEAGKKKTAQNGTLGTNDIITFLERINTSEVQ